MAPGSQRRCRRWGKQILWGGGVGKGVGQICGGTRICVYTGRMDKCMYGRLVGVGTSPGVVGMLETGRCVGSQMEWVVAGRSRVAMPRPGGGGAGRQECNVNAKAYRWAVAGSMAGGKAGTRTAAQADKGGGGGQAQERGTRAAGR